MKRAALTGIRTIKPEQIDEPLLTNPGEVKIKLSCIGICGSDIHYFTEGRIGTQVVDFPFTLGHECSGIVEKTGEEVVNVKEGDLVVVDPAIHCGICDQCLSGRPHTCRNIRFLGCPGQMEGCLSEYIVMPSFSCYPVTGQLNPVQAALIEPLSIGVYAVKEAHLESREVSSAIFGAGPIGLSIMMKLKADGITNTGVIEPLGYRLKKAGETGAGYLVDPIENDIEEVVARYENLLLDVVFEASGEQEAVNNALKILKPGGKLVLVGIPPHGQYTFDMDLMRRKELTIVNIRRQNNCVKEAIDLVINGKIRVEKMVSHHFNIEDTARAFEIVEGYKDGVIKAVIHL